MIITVIYEIEYDVEDEILEAVLDKYGDVLFLKTEDYPKNKEDALEMVDIYTGFKAISAKWQTEDEEDVIDITLF